MNGPFKVVLRRVGASTLTQNTSFLHFILWLEDRYTENKKTQTEIRLSAASLILGDTSRSTTKDSISLSLSHTAS